MAEQLTPTQLVEALRADRRQRWQRGDRILAEKYFQLHPTLQSDPARAVELVYHEVLLREELGETPQLDEYLRRFPQWTDQLRPLFEVHRALEDGKLFSDPGPNTLREEAAPASDVGESEPLPSVPGYDVLECLGRGGMGVVYRARHHALNRVVALKMIRAGAQAERAGRARLRAEAEAQARLQHPNIVPIYEVGEVDGCPYLALEYVAGGTLAQKLAGMPQPARPAAQLVETLVRAIHEAHQQGLVHRDLKPANVLLAADGTPKISDFGLVKHLQGGGGPTRSGEVLGTPSYMAPEQAGDPPAPVEPAADIYALGVILYEMLTGRPPFLAESALATLLQVRTLDPVPPRRLQPHVPRDLETICLTCLHKDPSRRYPTAEDLAEDLRRFRDGEPIRARPAGTVERGLKWARRQPAAAALVGVAVLMLLGGATGGLWYADHERNRAEQESALRHQAEQAEQQAKEQEVKAREEKDNARRSEADAKAVLDFFQDRVLAAARPESEDGGLGIHATIRDAIDAAEPTIAAAFHDRPLVEASIRHTLGLTYSYLGRYQAAIVQTKRALELRRDFLSPDHPDTVMSMNNLGRDYHQAGQLDKALPLLAQALAQCKKTFGPDHPSTLITMNNLALAYRDTDQFDKALPLFEETLARRQEKLGPNHPQTLTSMNNLALAYKDTGQLDKALPLCEQALTRRRENLGPKHPDTLTSMDNLAHCYLAAQQPDRALPLLHEFLAAQRQRLGPDHPRLAGLLATVGYELLKHAHHIEAEHVLRESLTISEAKQPTGWATFNTKSMLGGSLLGQQKYAEAEPLLVQGYEGMKAREKTIPPKAKIRLVNEALDRLVQLYDAWGKKDQADHWRKHRQAELDPAPKPK